MYMYIYMYIYTYIYIYIERERERDIQLSRLSACVGTFQMRVVQFRCLV